MPMFEKLKSKSILLSWRFSYILFILISVLIIAALYLGTVKTIKKEITISNDLLLNNMQSQVDSMIRSSKLLSDEIGLNKAINRLQYMAGNYDTIDTYSMYEAFTTLKNYYLVNPAIRSIYIYYKKNDIILSNSSINSIENFYSIYFGDSNIPYEDWEKIFVQKYETAEFMLVPSNHDYIFHLTSYPFMSINDNYMTVILELNKDKFFIKMDESAKLNSSSFFMLSSKNEVLPLSQNNNSLLNAIDYNALSWKPDFTVRRIDNTNIVFSYIPSKEATWKYVVAMPEKIFWQHSIDLLKFTALGILAAIIIGSIAMHISVRYNYNPVHELLASLEEKYGYRFNKNLNEYSFIKRSFDHVADEQHKSKMLLENQNKALNSAILARLIKGNTTHFTNMKDVLYRSKLDIDFENFVVILFYIEGFESFDTNLSSEKNLNILEEYSLSQFIVMNIADELISAKAKFISTEVDNFIVYIVNSEPDTAGEPPESLIAVTEEIKNYIDEHCDFEIMTSVSKPYHDLSTLSDCFYEALEIIEYKRILDSDSNTVYQDLNSGAASTEFYFPPQKEYLLMQGVKNDDFENVKLIIEDLFKQNIVTGKPILELYYCVMLSILSTLIKTISTMKSINALDILGHLEIIKRMKRCNTSSNIKAETLSIAEYIMNAIKELDSAASCKRNGRLTEEIAAFVEEHYHQSELSVTYIAEAFNQNAVQMSKIFRNTTSEALPDYINKYRIEHAKAIMKKGYSNLEELAHQVGFCNTKTLTRAFKKYVGTSPGCYKSTID